MVLEDYLDFEGTLERISAVKVFNRTYKSEALDSPLKKTFTDLTAIHTELEVKVNGRDAVFNFSFSGLVLSDSIGHRIRVYDDGEKQAIYDVDLDRWYKSLI